MSKYKIHDIGIVDRQRGPLKLNHKAHQIDAFYDAFLLQIKGGEL